ncbi:hypothetical protein ABT095_24210 [Kitasatospora sp. NPDC002227]|uniref:hypothetical protein n=1 Tax=Kitasatospora sp. NPDC002227 TaxID=3154773 RepID=UPI003333E383
MTGRRRGRRLTGPVAAALAVACLGACGAEAHPQPAGGVRWQGGALGWQPPGKPDAAAVVRADAVAAGHPPVDDLTEVYATDTVAAGIWRTAAGETCLGTYSATLRLGVTCSPARPLVEGSEGALVPLFGPAAMRPGHDWLTLFAAVGAEAAAVSCGDDRTTTGFHFAVDDQGKLLEPLEAPSTLRLVDQWQAANGRLVYLYAYVTPWQPAGTVQAEVVRPSGRATEPVPLGPRPAGATEPCAGPPTGWEPGLDPKRPSRGEEAWHNAEPSRLKVAV